MRFTECLNDTTKNSGVLAFAVDPGLVRTSVARDGRALRFSGVEQAKL
jgi:hypothetical protein